MSNDLQTLVDASHWCMFWFQRGKLDRSHFIKGLSFKKSFKESSPVTMSVEFGYLIKAVSRQLFVYVKWMPSWLKA
jgi:outer membrane protease